MAKFKVGDILVLKADSKLPDKGWKKSMIIKIKNIDEFEHNGYIKDRYTYLFLSDAADNHFFKGKYDSWAIEIVDTNFELASTATKLLFDKTGV